MDAIDFLGINLQYSKEVFRPTLISEHCARLTQYKDKSILDLGCGIGPLAIYFAKNGASKVSACDIFDPHIEFTKKNAVLNDVEIEVIKSDLFEKIDDKFDVICCDVSGVDKRIAELTGWFPGDVPKADNSGSNLIIKVVEESTNYLNSGGNLYIATTSFSDLDIIEKRISANYSNYEIIYKIEIPFSKRLKKNINQIDKKMYVSREEVNYWEFSLYKCTKN
tara:strand:- start:1640 stop:2305 length:666 start_codon:yes stop_codon:yes gene_type:complete